MIIVVLMRSLRRQLSGWPATEGRDGEGVREELRVRCRIVMHLP